MQATSLEYKSEQKRDLRNASHVFVYLGVINKEAQANAYIDTSLTILEPYSSTYIFQEPKFEAFYASLEENFTKVDGSMEFLPEDATAYALFQGAVTTAIGGSITFYFTEYSHLNIKGLTIDFGEYYPTSFTATNGSVTYTYTDNTESSFVTEDVFNDTEYITITPISMVGGQQRLRIHSMIFGVGLTFDNQTLISTSRKNVVDHLSNSLPVKTFTFTVSNIGKRFNKDNPYSFANFLETEQACSFEYGREMDDGYIYRIEGGNVALKTWSSNDTQAKFSCVGYMDFMTGTFYRGQFRPNGITAYALAEEVFEDAGITDYRIDAYLRRITLYNPLPLTTHKNCLQLIANATQSILYEDREGKIIIESSFTPEIVSVTAANATNYSETATLQTADGAATNYASLENDFSKVDGSLKFLPSNVSSAYPVGYVSNTVADDTGVMTTDSTITVTWEAQWTFYGLELTYTPWAKPSSVTVVGYGDGTEVIRTTSEDPEVVAAAFRECDQIVVYFNGTESGQRIHCKTIKVGDVSDYSITYHELADTPVATSVENVKYVDVHYFNFAYGEESSSVTTASVNVGENLITFSTPYYNYAAAYKSGGGTVEIVESGAYYVLIDASAAGSVEITAQKIDVADNTLQYVASEIGGTKTVKNQLISSRELAEKEGEWVGNYYASNTEYSLSFRGEPALDCDDLIYLENKFVDKNLIRITSETLDTSTGMSTKAHKLKAVRVSYAERT